MPCERHVQCLHPRICIGLVCRVDLFSPSLATLAVCCFLLGGAAAVHAYRLPYCSEPCIFSSSHSLASPAIVHFLSAINLRPRSPHTSKRTTIYCFLHLSAPVATFECMHFQCMDTIDAYRLHSPSSRPSFREMAAGRMHVQESLGAAIRASGAFRPWSRLRKRWLAQTAIPRGFNRRVEALSMMRPVGRTNRLGENNLAFSMVALRWVHLRCIFRSACMSEKILAVNSTPAKSLPMSSSVSHAFTYSHLLDEKDPVFSRNSALACSLSPLPSIFCTF